MLTTLRAAIHGYAARQHLRDLTYASGDAHTRELLGASGRTLSRHGVRSDWSTRTTASMLGALWIYRSAAMLDEVRRVRVARAILEQEEHGMSPLEWYDEFSSGRFNPVGTDMVLMRYNVGRGVIASWIVEQRRIDPDVLRAFATMAALGCAGTTAPEAERSFERLIRDIDANQFNH